MQQIAYKINEATRIETIIELFYHSDYLPIEDMSDISRLMKMFKNANLVVSAWDNDKLVGISRSLCDFSYCCYLSDICVHKEYRKRNIGQRLVEKTKEKAGKECKLILHSNTHALQFYKKIGMQRISDAFIIQREY